MASNEVPTQNQGPVDNTPDWLKEVKADAEYTQKQREREAAEKLAHEQAKEEQKKK